MSNALNDVLERTHYQGKPVLKSDLEGNYMLSSLRHSYHFPELFTRNKRSFKDLNIDYSPEE
jgi:hypothetical protein